MIRRQCLVTGASAGIGAASARIFASHGYNIVLTARRADRLERLAEEIGLRYGVETLIVPADLADPAAVDALLAEIGAHGLVIDALVNNAGYALPGVYGASPWEHQRAMLQVLLVAVCELTHKLLPGMIERGYGRILNVASLAGLAPGPARQTLYAASKAFLVRFSQSLRQETLDHGVHVSALCPGFTYSEFHDVNSMRAEITRPIPAWRWMGPDEVAASGYEAVEANRAVCVPGAPNKALAAVAKILPEDWTAALMEREAARAR